MRSSQCLTIRGSHCVSFVTNLVFDWEEPLLPLLFFILHIHIHTSLHYLCSVEYRWVCTCKCTCKPHSEQFLLGCGQLVCVELGRFQGRVSCRIETRRGRIVAACEQRAAFAADQSGSTEVPTVRHLAGE